MILPVDLIKILRPVLKSRKYLILFAHLEKNPEKKGEFIIKYSHKMKNFPVDALDQIVNEQVKIIKKSVAHKVQKKDPETVGGVIGSVTVEKSDG